MSTTCARPATPTRRASTRNRPASRSPSFKADPPEKVSCATPSLLPFYCVFGSSPPRPPRYPPRSL
jgi:hypothetical protein